MSSTVATTAALGAEQWSEADRLFRPDPRWRGSDCAYSVHVGGDRVVWLFNDTFIAAGADAPRGRTLICNTVGVQDGLDPRSASIRFVWREDEAGEPAAFFPRRESAVMWPGPGAMVGERMVVVGRWVAFTDAPPPWGFAYEADAWWLVDNPVDEPEDWRIRTLDEPRNGWGIEMGAGSFLADGDHLLQYCPGPSHDIHLARWLAADVAAGAVADPEWYRGDGVWSRESEDGSLPLVVLPHGQSEFSVTPHNGGFVQVQGIGTHDAVLAVRRAATPEGPWSELLPVFTPPEAARPEVFCYAFKAHPHLTGDGVVVTYATNRDIGDVADDESLYWPRFVVLEELP